jgi:hypothetical protein
LRAGGVLVLVLMAVLLPAAPAMADVTITSTGPLTSIYLGESLACQVDLGDGARQIFGGVPGSCFTDLVATGLVPSSQSAVTGGGTSPNDPFTVTTEMFNSAGITLRRTDTYVTGDRFWTSEVTVINSSGAPLDDVLWHGLDCFVAGNDAGYGFFAAGTGAVYCAQNAGGGNIMLGLVPNPSSPPSRHYEGPFSGAFQPGPTGFGNTCSGDFVDNGAGLSWQISVPNGSQVSRTFRTTFEPAGTRCAVTAQPDTLPPDATISSAPPGSTPSRDASFSFGSSDPSARFECSLDGGAFEACSSPKSYTGLSEGAHTFVVRAIDAAGNQSSDTHSWTIAAQAQRKTLKDLPPPVVGKMANVEPVKGTVLVGIPAGKSSAGGAARASQKGLRFVPLEEARQIPIGSFMNTRKGTVRLQNAVGAATTKTQQGNFGGGLFQVLQSRKKRAKGLTDLVLKGGKFNNCKPKRRSRPARAALSRRRLRRLRANAKGRYRTRGRYSAATVRGTKWTVTDRCDGTLTKVSRGKVAVRDFRRKRTILLRAGKSYLAKAKR